MSDKLKDALVARERRSRGEPEPKPTKPPKKEEPKEDEAPDGGDAEGQS